MGRLNFKTTKEKLEEVFSAYGKINRVSLVLDKNTGQSKGYAFIEFMESRQAEIAFRRADGKKIDDFAVIVDMEQARIDKYWLPRRLGGGRGGEKRKATKGHSELMKEIKREFRKEVEREKEKQGKV